VHLPMTAGSSSFDLRALEQARLSAGRTGRTLGQAIGYHGLAGLVGRNPRAMEELPEACAERVAKEAIDRTKWELRHRQCLAALFDRMADVGIRPLVLKGTALAYWLYDEPAARVRGDTDLLVAESELDGARAALAQSGFAGGAASRHALQEQWLFAAEDGSRHEIDLHWHALNSPALAHILAPDELRTRAVPLHRLHPAVDRPGAAHMALHLACHWAVARAGTYADGAAVVRGEGRLIWLYDLALLALGFGAEDRAEVRDVAGHSGLGTVVAEAFAAARDMLDAPVEDGWLESFRELSADRAACAYLLSQSRLERAWLDLRAFKPKRHLPAYALHRFAVAFAALSHGGVRK
jgi:hypothetical protein